MKGGLSCYSDVHSNRLEPHAPNPRVGATHVSPERRALRPRKRAMHASPLRIWDRPLRLSHSSQTPL